MRIYINARHETTAYASVRMTKEEYARVRRNFRADEEMREPDIVHIARGTFLVKQGYGWYRLVNFSGNNWLDRIQFAARKLIEWKRTFVENRNQLLRQLMGYGGPVPARPESIQRLVSHFQERRVS